jgi:hypothetical protein
VRIVRHYRIDVLNISRHRARNDSSLHAPLFRPRIKYEKLSAFSDQPAKFVDGDPVHAKLTDQCLSPPSSNQHIQSKHNEHKQDPTFADICDCTENIDERTLKYLAELDGHSHKYERSDSVEQKEGGQRHLGDTSHSHRDCGKERFS